MIMNSLTLTLTQNDCGFIWTLSVPKLELERKNNLFDKMYIHVSLDIANIVSGILQWYKK